MNILLGLIAAVTVQTATLETIENDAPIVTNVVATSDLPPDYTTTNAVKELIKTNLNYSAGGDNYGIEVSNAVEAAYADEADAATVGGSIDTRINALPSYDSVTNAITNIVTKSYVESLGIAGGVDTNAVKEIVAYKRDLTNNVCAAESFTAWSATPPSGYTFGDAQPVFNGDTEKWTWYVEGPSVAVDAESGASTADATSATFTFDDSGTKTFTATRSKAAYSNDLFATYGFVTNAATAKANAAIAAAGCVRTNESGVLSLSNTTGAYSGWFGALNLGSFGYLYGYGDMTTPNSGRLKVNTAFMSPSVQTLAYLSDIPAEVTSNTVANWGYASKKYADDANESTRAIVETWESFLDGSNVVFSITNYISGAYRLDAAKLRILEMTNGVYREVYNSRDEIVMHLADFETNKFNRATNSVITAIDAKVATKADKAWGQYTSAGGIAPSNTVYMTAPNTVFAGGMEYERVAVGEGAICVLTTKGAPVWTQGDEGTFKFQDDGGTNYFGFAKTDSYTIGANTDGISVANNVVTLTWDVTMSGVPVIWYTTNLTSSVVWEQLNLPDKTPVSGASHVVSWEQNPPAGTKVAYINVTGEPKGFFKATLEFTGEAKFMTNMPADLSGGILCTNTATGVMGIIKPSYNGSTVNWTWSAN